MVKQHRCPICRSTMPAAHAGDSKYFPFCSERCRSVDLLRWSDGRYAIVEPLSPMQQLDLELDDAEFEGLE